MGNDNSATDNQVNTPSFETKDNLYAILGFILSFFINIVGLIFSIIGYREANRLGGKGKKFALAGIIISACSIGASVLGVIIAFAILPNAVAPHTSKLFRQLGAGGFLEGVGITLYHTVLSTAFAYLLGLPLGILLCVTDKDGIRPIVWLNRIVGFIVNILRSIPFIILMVALIPAARAVVGTSIGDEAMIFMLIVAATPYVARMVESSVKEVDKGVIEAARAMGTGTFGIIWKVLLPEAKPSLIVGAVISTVTIIGYSAMAGTIAGGGLGSIAVTKARVSNAQDVIWLCVALIVVIVQVIQEVGMYLAKRLDKRVSRNHKNKKIKEKGE